MTTTDDLKEEFHYYLEHQDEIVARHDGKTVAIIGSEVVGVFDSEVQAVREMQKKHELGTFLVQRVSEGSEAYTLKLNPRIILPWPGSADISRHARFRNTYSRPHIVKRMSNILQ